MPVQHTERLRIRVSPMVKRRCEIAAEIEGLSMAAWARNTLDREARHAMGSIETVILKGGCDGGVEVVVLHVAGPDGPRDGDIRGA